ncbi:hypothetical protein [Methylobacterium sp.]|uniref:hypothetical protein n=1 Tax=Methylobacterium sp. TaxID=409 RepID=UPI003AFF9F6E
MAPSASPARHWWLDEWLGAGSPRLERLVQEGAALVAEYEEQTAARKRRRRPDDQRRHLIAIQMVVANLAHAVLSPPPTGRLAVLTGNDTVGFGRYDNRALGKPFRGLLEALEGIGWLDWTTGHRDEKGRGTASSIAPTATFATRVREAGVSPADFGRIEGEEVIVVTRKLLNGNGEVLKKEKVDYPETETSRALRATMQDLNAFLGRADIAFLDDGLGPVDLRSRVQRRYFVADVGTTMPSFTLGGRLYGGAWQNLPKARRGNLRIEGEPVAVLDYSSMAPRLAYASLGLEAPAGDIYALPGLEAPELRPAVKRAFNTLLSDPFRQRSAWPAPGEGDPVLAPQWTVQRFRQALLTRHPALKGCLGTGMAPRLQNTESVILVEVLLEMKTRGIPVLSLHDGLFCPVSRSTEVRKVMEDAALDVTKVNIPVDVKALPDALLRDTYIPSTRPVTLTDSSVT